MHGCKKSPHANRSATTADGACQSTAMGIVKFFMPAYIVITVLFAALLHALWNIIVKGGENKLFETGLNALGAGIGAACIVPFLPLPDPACLPYLGMSCICHFTYYICIAEAYKKVDLTFAYTIMRGSAPLLTSLAMLFFGESLSLGAWCGVLTLCCGVFCLARDNAQRGAGRSAIFISLRTSFVIMGYTLADGLGAQHSGNAISYACWIFVLNIVPLHVFILRRHGMTYLRYVQKRAAIGLFGGLAGLGSYGIAIWAMTLAPIAMVAALRETSVIFGMLLAVILLHEKFTIWRGIAVILVACGAMLLKLA